MLNQFIRSAEIKLQAYKRVVRILVKVEKQGIVFEKDYRQLRYLFSERIMPHLEREHLKEVAANLTAIGRCVGIGDENARLYDELKNPVSSTVNILMRALGFNVEPDETTITEMENAEDEFFPRLFRQAIKEALDNVLVNYSDFHLFNRGQYVKEKDGEYITFSFINDHPHGCKLMIGPFTNTPGAEILFRLHVPRYAQTAGLDFDADTAELNYSEVSGFADIYVENREMPLSISKPFKDSCLINLWQEDRYNDYIPSFSFEDAYALARYRRNYAEVASVLGQRVKYIFLHAYHPVGGMPLDRYIARLANIDPYALYPCVPWELTESGDIAY